MTHLLWKYYWDDNVEKFRHLLAPTGYAPQSATRSSNIASGGPNPGYGTSPRPAHKSRKASGLGAGPSNSKHGNGALGKAEVNSRDHAGLTVLLRAASSTADNAIAYVEALLEHPAIDIYVQDPESGWNALHRALYAGNVSIARLLLEKERQGLAAHAALAHRVGHLIKTKDHEGNSPFDLYNSTVGERTRKETALRDVSEAGSESGGEAADLPDHAAIATNPEGIGEDLYAFGSNRNFTLGFGDQDDRQFPERVFLQRPDHLLQRFHNEYLEETGDGGSASQDLSKIPTLVLSRPLVIQDVVLSKLHSAVLTTDPVCNLYVCGVGRGGRLGLGDENTRFTYTPVLGPFADKKVTVVALGQNHSMAVDDAGALWTWGSNAQCQLGYALPLPAKKDEDPISTVPRQVFGPLKKEFVLGIAASSIHSVAHTGTSLFSWGRNVGQLALMDADSRSLEFQQTPRKVAASLFPSPIVMVSAIDKATTVLLQNHSVYIFTSYGYHIVKFPWATFEMAGNIKLSMRFEPGWNQIHHITSGGETIAALTKRGDLFTMNLDHKTEANPPAMSTTNPSKIKGSVTQPQRIWSATKDGVRSVGVSEHGSVIISTKSGAVWRRIKRPKAKDAYSGASESKRGDFKFQRVPCITKVATVRASPFGAFAAIRRDSDVMKKQLTVADQSLWKDVAPLSCLVGFEASAQNGGLQQASQLWGSDIVKERLGLVAYEVLKSQSLEQDLLRHLTNWSYRKDPLDAAVCTTAEPSIKIPVHGWLLAARSPVLRGALAQFRRKGSYEQVEAFTIGDCNGSTVISFQGLDLISLVNVVHFMYEDKVVPAWNFTRQSPPLAYRFRQIRLEVMKLATRLGMGALEAAARLQVDPEKHMDEDFRRAIKDRRFFEDGDAILELDGIEVQVHSTFVCQRCPWFEGLFHGRSRGMWLAGRRDAAADSNKRIKIDLKDMEPTAFKYVVQYLYGDYGSELFDPSTCSSFDDFLDLVMEVMSAANYLMLDRLSQICQKVMGRFANIRNISHLLNAISPCSVTDFKDASLEYICLQLETMLENHLLDELDKDLLVDLDKAVRENQASQMQCMPSGQAELVLLEKNPGLAEDIQEERQIRVKEMAFKAAQRDEERRLSLVKGKFGSLEDASPLTAGPEKVRKAASKAGSRNEPFSPELRPKRSQADLMFDMDEEVASPSSSPLTRPRKLYTDDAGELDRIPPLERPWKAKGRDIRVNFEDSPPASPSTTLQPRTPGIRPDVQKPVPHGSSLTPTRSGTGGVPWGGVSNLPPMSKTDLRDIIQSETSNRASALSAGIAAQRSNEAGSASTTPKSAQKLSQKEKKRQQQEALAAQASLMQAAKAQETKKAWEKSPGEASSVAPWKLVSKASGPSPATATANHASPPAPIARRTASPDTRFAGQRAASSTSIPSHPAASASQTPSRSPHGLVEPKTPAPLVPHSKTYLAPPPKAEPILGLSMADIMGQQTRDKQVVKEAAAKRSLQEIQQEQEFQEWWDAESRRMQEEELKRIEREREREKEREGGKVEGKRGGRRLRGNGEGRGGGGHEGGDRGGKKDGGDTEAGASAGAGAGAGNSGNSNNRGNNTRRGGHDGGSRSRGRGRGGGGGQHGGHDRGRQPEASAAVGAKS